jgi:hypothetical protein
MKFKCIDSVPVSTSALQDRAPHWLELSAPELVPPAWYRLIASFVQSAVVAWEASPPERLDLYVAQVGNRLSFTYDLPAEAKERNPAAVAALRAEADLLDQLSDLVRASDVNGSGNRSAGCNTTCVFDEKRVGAQEFSLPLSEAQEADAQGQLDDHELCSPDQVISVFSWAAAPYVDGGRHRGRDGDSASRIEALMKRLKSSGFTRPLRAPTRGWESSLDTLEKDCPNFASLIEAVIRPHLALLSRGYTHRMSSVLVVGPPGIGKTHFAHQLAKILDVGRPMFISMAAETNASSLSGLSAFWSNSSPGKLFERLAWGEAGAVALANPLVILDELDKAVADRFDPLGPLYALWEAETARTFQDQSLPDVLIDASHVRFIATANDIASIPEPLLSRTMVFHIKSPTRVQLQRVIQRIYEDIVDRLGVPICTQLPASVIECAMPLSPREAKVRLECAIAKAVSESRECLSPSDWLETDLGSGRRKTIGFTPQ